MIKKLRTNQSFFGVIFLALILLPIITKMMINGLLGPTFNFYFFIFWIPLISIGIAVLRGWQEAAFTSIFIVGSILFSLMSYPHNPTMDFRRQIVQQADIAIVIASMGSLVLQVYLHQRRIRRGNGGSPLKL